MTGLQEENILPNSFDSSFNWFDTSCQINSMGLPPTTQDKDCLGLPNISQRITIPTGTKMERKYPRTYMAQEEMVAQILNQKEFQTSLLEAPHFNKRINP